MPNVDHDRLGSDLSAVIGRALSDLRRAALSGGGLPVSGRLREATGTLVEATLPGVKVGEICRLFDPSAGLIDRGEVVGFRGQAAIIAPFKGRRGLSTRIEVVRTGKTAGVRVGGNLGGGLCGWEGNLERRFAPTALLGAPTWRYLSPSGMLPVGKAPISQIFRTNLRAVDGLLTVGVGQRMGVFGNAGAGKSTFIDCLLRGATADVYVLGLIGERGREVAEMIDGLTTSAMSGRTIVFSSTSDRPAVERLNTAFAATACAEHFRDQGQDVLLVIDSITRVARAARDIGLARGEPPTRRGFPPSVFETLPLLFERAGATQLGSITAFYTVLVEGMIGDDPIAEETKSLLDGHIILSSDIAQKGVYPAVDVLQSISRSMHRIVSSKHQAAAKEFRRLLSVYSELELILRLGEYRRGSDPGADFAIDKNPELQAFMSQALHEQTNFEQMFTRLQDAIK